jgi:hypothetical protein
LPRSGGWILRREIPESDLFDGMACYPLLSCVDWGGLGADLAELRKDLVSFCAVIDPFAPATLDALQDCFTTRLIPFKEHLVVDLSSEIERTVCAHHRRYARKALETLEIERCPTPPDHLEEWSELYACLVKRHRIQGIRTFSRKAFAAQLQVPGCVAFRARRHGQTVGMLLWYEEGALATYHLGACNAAGYHGHASFGLFWKALEHFSGRGLRWLNLGGGAGIVGDEEEGLSSFKRGWANCARPAYFGARIFQPDAYEALVQARGIEPEGYFPAYRAGEFV